MKVCAEPGCPTLTPQSRCPTHQRARDKQRGTRQQRGYNREHDLLRAQWAPRVATGNVRCWRCHTRIQPSEPWHLGHDDTDRTIHRGPEHTRCNLSAAGRNAHR